MHRNSTASPRVVSPEFYDRALKAHEDQADLRRLSDTSVMLGFVTDDDELVCRQVRWAHLYDGYQRLASTPSSLARLIESARREWESTGRIPDWCGVDFLRGWAFYIARADRHGGGYGLEPGGSMLAQWRAVLLTISIHTGARDEDAPPM